MAQQSRSSFTRTIHDLENLVDSEYIRSKKFSDFRPADLMKISSEDYRHLCKKKIHEISEQFLKTVEKLPNEEVTRFEQAEVKNLTKALSNFRDQCERDGLSVREFEQESVEFITDKYKRFFFNSKWSQLIYNAGNTIASTSLGYWGFRSVKILGSTNRFLLTQELRKSILPISFFTGITLRFWSYIATPFPTVSKALDGLSHIAMSPIWLVESVLNAVTAKIYQNSPLKVAIPLNITGEVAMGSGLTWDKLNHTVEFVQNMSKNWAK